MHKFSLLFIGLFVIAALQAQTENIERQIRRIIEDKKAEVGVAVIFYGKKDTIVINNDKKYPLMSVFKFHQALAVANYIENNGLSFDTQIQVAANELNPNTYSPLYKKYPRGGIFTIGQLLKYTLVQSDNNACNILFDRTVTPAQTDAYIRSLGFNHFAIEVTEAEMEQDVEASYRNWTTPLDAVSLLTEFLTEDLLSPQSIFFIAEAMANCETGSDRLMKPMEDDMGHIIACHRTGTGGRNKEGQIIATNDMAFVVIATHDPYIIAVFVKDSEETPETNAQIIADISEAVYTFVTGD